MKRRIACLGLVLVLITAFIPLQGNCLTNDLEQFIRQQVVDNKIMNIETIKNLAVQSGYTGVTTELIQNEIDEIIAEKGNEVYTNVGGFIQTYSMLEKRYNEITWAGTHNSYSNNIDRTLYSFTYDRNTGTRNHNTGVQTHLERGTRFIDLDFGPHPEWNEIFLPSYQWSNIGCYHRLTGGGISGVHRLLEKIRDFCNQNTNEIVTIKVAQIWDGYFGEIDFNSDPGFYWAMVDEFMRSMYDVGLMNKVYNYYGSASSRTAVVHQGVLSPQMAYNGYTMGNWPKLKEMIEVNKRIILVLPNQNQQMYFFGSPSAHEEMTPQNINFSTQTMVDFSQNPYGLFILEYFPDEGASAGWEPCANIANEGRRAYELLNRCNTLLSSVNRIPNYITTDFFYGKISKGGNQDVDTVDAINRLNMERINAWNQNTPGYWSLYPTPLYGEIPISSITTSISNDTAALKDGSAWTGITFTNTNTEFYIDLGGVCSIKKAHANFLIDHDIPTGYEVKALINGQYTVVASGAWTCNTAQAWYQLLNSQDSIQTDMLLVKIINSNSKTIKLKEFAVTAQ